MVNYDEILNNTASFNMTGQDVMVFLHIQKTGGTIFGKHLVKDINLERRCECSKGWKNGRRKKMRCACHRPGKGTVIFFSFSFRFRTEVQSRASR
jgi:hypothetical protein